MRDIGYYVVNDEFRCVNEDGKILDNIPRGSYLEVKASQVPMHLYVYGNVVKYGENKSPLSVCRDLISIITLDIVLPNEKAHQGYSVEKAMDYLNPSDNETVVVVNNITFEEVGKNINALKTLSRGFYDIVVKEVKSRYSSVDDVVVYWDYADMNIGVTNENNILVLRG